MADGAEEFSIWRSKTHDRQEFYKTDDIYRSAQDRITKSRVAGEAVAYLSIPTRPRRGTR